MASAAVLPAEVLQGAAASQVLNLDVTLKPDEEFRREKKNTVSLMLCC
jgi:hypothetical protein